jgi:DNA-binding response OmpR family regulator
MGLVMTEEPSTILVVDDEESILELLDLGLGREGFRVLAARTGAEALDLFRAENPDLVVLDWMLPEVDGLEVCRRLRASNQVPILMLTARNDVDDRVRGLETGADDYLPKPFKFKELLARVRALLRRAGSDPGNRLGFDDVVLDRRERRVTRAGQPVELTVKEFEILEYLLRHPRQVLSREQILNQVWGWDYPGGANVVEVHLSALRAKLGDSDRRLIRTVRGVGYALGS